MEGGPLRLGRFPFNRRVRRRESHGPGGCLNAFAGSRLSSSTRPDHDRNRRRLAAPDGPFGHARLEFHDANMVGRDPQTLTPHRLTLATQTFILLCVGLVFVVFVMRP